MYITCTYSFIVEQCVFAINKIRNLYIHTVQLKQKTQSPCLIKDYRKAELTRDPCVYVDGLRNNMDMTDRTRCLHESITDCNY